MSRNISTTHLLVALLALTSTACASNRAALTLEQCVELGLQRSTELQNARRDELISESRVHQARSQALPALDAVAGYTRLDEVTSIPDTSITFGRLDNYSAGLEARQLLYSGGSVSAAMEAAKDFRDVTRRGFEQTRNAVLRKVSVSFYEILYARARVDVARRSVEQLKGFVEESRAKFANGLISNFDMLSAEVKLANEKPKLVRDRNALEIERAAFARLLKLDSDSFNLAGELNCGLREFNLGQLIDIALRERPDLKAGAARVRLREADVRITKGDRLPEISARGNYTGTNPDQQSFSAQDEWGWNWEVGLDISWSLIDGGLRRAELMEKRLEQEKAEADRDDLERQIELEVRQSYLTLQNAREVVASSREAVKLAEKAFDIAETRYTQELSTYLEYSDSNLALSRARLNRAESIARYLQALADLRFACGVEKLPGGEE